MQDCLRSEHRKFETYTFMYVKYFLISVNKSKVMVISFSTLYKYFMSQKICPNFFAYTPYLVL